MSLIVGEDGALVPVLPSPVVRLRETSNLLARQVEDIFWVSMGADPTSRLDSSYDVRQRTIERARQMARTSPLAKTAVNLLQHYVLGQGTSVKAQNRPIIARVVDEFMNDPRNKTVITAHQAQKEFLAGLFEDGDYFLVLFPDTQAGTLQLGWIDAAMVEDAIPDPNNVKITKWYKARKPNVTFNFASGTWDASVSQEFVYYRHWQNDDPPPPGMGNLLQPGLVYQVSVDRRGKFGRSQLANAMDWLKAHKDFMEDRASINRAAAAVAWKKKRSGSASDVAAEAKKIQSTLVSRTDRFDANPPRATASTVVENMGSTLEWVDTNTGGAAADFDERKLRMMAGAGMGGIPNHYFGDEAQANLATATAMELPMLKMYEDYQQTIRTVLGDLIDFALAVAFAAGRIGPRDDSDRYAERVTTPQGVMDSPEQDAAPAAANSPVQTRPASTVVKTVITREMAAVIRREIMTMPIREAIQLPYSPAPVGGLKLIPNPNPIEPTNLDPGQSLSEPLSWYVDIDFPPIVQKAIDIWMNAVKVLSDMLPSENIESRKLAVELALTAFGVNDIDETLSRIFPPDMIAVQMPAPPPPPQFGQPGGFPGGPRPPQIPARIGESEPESLAEIRRRRIYTAATGALAAIGS